MVNFVFRELQFEFTWKFHAYVFNNVVIPHSFIGKTYQNMNYMQLRIVILVNKDSIIKV